MTTETLRELQDRILVLNSATNAKGQRLALVDHKFKTELFQLRVQLADREKAELPQGPQINRNQLHGFNPVDHAYADPAKQADLKLLDRAQGAKDPKTGKRYAETNPQFNHNLQNARVAIFEGKALPAGLVASTTKLVEQK
jgi:hypothetical protein